MSYFELLDLVEKLKQELKNLQGYEAYLATSNLAILEEELDKKRE